MRGREPQGVRGLRLPGAMTELFGLKLKLIDRISKASRPVPGGSDGDGDVDGGRRGDNAELTISRHAVVASKWQRVLSGSLYVYGAVPRGGERPLLSLPGIKSKLPSCRAWNCSLPR